MKVKALCTIKDGSGWHRAGEVFETKENLGDLVEIVAETKTKPEAKPEPEVKEPEAEEPKPKATRKRKLTETE